VSLSSPPPLRDEPAGPDALLQNLRFILRQEARFLLSCIAVGLVIGAFIDLLTPTVYRAQGTFLIDEVPFTTLSQQASDAETTRQLVESLILSIPGEEMRKAVAAKLGVHENDLSFTQHDPPVSMRGNKGEKANIEVTATRDSRLGQIAAESPDPKFAVRVINEILQQISVINRIAGRMDRIEARIKFELSSSDSLVQQLTEASGQRLKLEKEVQSLDQYSSANQALDAFPSFATDATLNNLKTQLILVQSEYDSIAANSTSGNSLAGKRAELDSLRQQVGRHANDLAASLRASVQIAQRNEASLRDDLSKMQDDMTALQTERSQMAKGFGDFSARARLISDSDNGQETEANVIVVVDSAFAPKRPVRPRMEVDLFLGLLFGLGLGAGGVFLRFRFDHRLRSPEQIETLAGLPCLAVFPEGEDPEAPLDFEDPITLGALGFLRRHLVLAQNREFKNQVFIFAPLDPHADTAPLVSQTARLLHALGNRVLVVDLNFIGSALPGMLGLSPAKGIADWFHAGDALSNYVANPMGDQIGFLAAGKASGRLDDLVIRRPLGTELADLGRRWDFLLISGPPILDVWRILQTAPVDSKIIAAAYYDLTSVDDLIDLKRNAAEFRLKVDGVVLEGFPRELLNQETSSLGLRRHRYLYPNPDQTPRWRRLISKITAPLAAIRARKPAHK